MLNLTQQLAAAREREEHYQNRIWLAMTDIAEGQALRAYDVLRDVSKELEAAHRQTESEASDGD